MLFRSKQNKKRIPNLQLRVKKRLLLNPQCKTRISHLNPDLNPNHGLGRVPSQILNQIHLVSVLCINPSLNISHLLDEIKVKVTNLSEGVVEKRDVFDDDNAEVV